MRFIKGERYDWNSEGGACPACSAYDIPKGGVLVKRKQKRTGNSGVFLGCTRYPKCKYTTGSFTETATPKKRTRSRKYRSVK